jgi:hypothetical protein
MNTDDDMRTPTLKEICNIADASFVKELPSLRPDVIDAPVEVLHPVLSIP